MTQTPERIEVAAAAIIRSGSVLLSLRKPDAHQGNKWEFPGGKLETGEAPEHGLIRELHEELGITATQYQKLLTLSHDYPDKSVTLHVFLVEDFDGSPQGAEGQAIEWFNAERMRELEFPDANYPILEEVIHYLNHQQTRG